MSNIKGKGIEDPFERVEHKDRQLSQEIKDWLNANKSQDEIIKHMWKTTPDDEVKYQEAVREFERLRNL